MNEIIYVTIVLVLWNIAIFTLYGIDKSKAQNKQWRISENTLISCAFLMGGVGAMLGMRIFRHKTKQVKFKRLVPLAIVINVFVILGCLHFIVKIYAA